MRRLCNRVGLSVGLISVLVLASLRLSGANMSVGLFGKPHDEPNVVVPHQSYSGDVERDLKQKSYPIENNIFIEAEKSRCFANTVVEDPKIYEPTFVVFKGTTESRISALATPDEIRRTGLRTDQDVYIFVHGFTQSFPKTDWLRDVATRFVENGHSVHDNAIIMDWGPAANQGFSKAAAMVSAMGSYLSNFIQKLLQMGVHWHRIHLVCHSLGGHVCGFAGKKIRPRIGRITALDPAGPCFGKVASNGPQDRLSYDDAYEVDVYHYDDEFLGIGNQQIGQFDVFVNGGSSQPGCKGSVDTMVNAALTVALRRNKHLSESHTRSTEVATSQLANSGCQEVAYSCRSYAAFTHGECGLCARDNLDCFHMGFHYQYRNMQREPLRQTQTPRKFYIRTSDEDNFCLLHYQLLLRLEPSAELDQKKLEFIVTLGNDRNEHTNITISHQKKANVYSHLLLLKGDVTRVTSARVLAVDGFKKTAPLEPATANHVASSAIQLTGIDINFMSNIDPDFRAALSSKLCPFQSESDGSIRLVECASQARFAAHFVNERALYY